MYEQIEELINKAIKKETNKYKLAKLIVMKKTNEQLLPVKDPTIKPEHPRLILGYCRRAKILAKKFEDQVAQYHQHIFEKDALIESGSITDLKYLN